MAFPDMPKPATARHGEPASKKVALRKLNTEVSIEIATDLQVRCLTRRCAITAAMAAIVAPFAFGGEGAQ